MYHTAARSHTHLTWHAAPTSLSSPAVVARSGSSTVCDWCTCKLCSCPVEGQVNTLPKGQPSIKELVAMVKLQLDQIGRQVSIEPTEALHVSTLCSGIMSPENSPRHVTLYLYNLSNSISMWSSQVLLIALVFHNDSAFRCKGAAKLCTGFCSTSCN